MTVRMCSGSASRLANRQAGTACHLTDTARAFPDSACKSARLRNIVKYDTMFIIYGKKYLMEFRADTAVNHFERLTLTKHGDIVAVGEIFNVGSRQFCSDRFILKCTAWRGGSRGSYSTPFITLKEYIFERSSTNSTIGSPLHSTMKKTTFPA